MTPSGIGVRSATVTGAVVLAAAGWLTTAAAANAAAPDPTSTAQPSPFAPPPTSFTATTGEPALTLTPTTARPGDPVTVTFDRWDFKSCALAYDDQQPQPPSTCTPLNGVLTGTVTVPSDAAPSTEIPIAACPTTCTGDNTIVTGLLTIAAPLVTTATTTPTPTQSQPLGSLVPVITLKPPPPVPAATQTSGHTATLVAGGAVVVVIGSVLGLLMLRRRPPTIGQPPDIHLVPSPDPGVVTVDPATAARDIHAHVTIRLRPDAGRCRVEAMQP